MENPDCSVESFVTRAFRLSLEDPIGNLVEPIRTAGRCISGLAAAGAIVVAGNVTTVVAAGAVLAAMETADACSTTLRNRHRSGVIANINCFFQPRVLTEEVQLCRCTHSCRTVGTRYSQGRYLPQLTRFRFGRLDQALSNNCYCTNDSKAVTCRLDCAEWTSNDPDDCSCNRPYL